MSEKLTDLCSTVYIHTQAHRYEIQPQNTHLSLLIFGGRLTELILMMLETQNSHHLLHLPENIVGFCHHINDCRDA